MDKNVIAIGYAIAAAAFYALNVPCSKMLLTHISPVFMAGLLYIGAGSLVDNETDIVEEVCSSKINLYVVY